MPHWVSLVHDFSWQKPVEPHTLVSGQGWLGPQSRGPQRRVTEEQRWVTPHWVSLVQPLVQAFWPVQLQGMGSQICPVAAQSASWVQVPGDVEQAPQDGLGPPLPQNVPLPQSDAFLQHEGLRQSTGRQPLAGAVGARQPTKRGAQVHSLQ